MAGRGLGMTLGDLPGDRNLPAYSYFTKIHSKTKHNGTQDGVFSSRRKLSSGMSYTVQGMALCAALWGAERAGTGRRRKNLLCTGYAGSRQSMVGTWTHGRKESTVVFLFLPPSTSKRDHTHTHTLTVLR